MTATEIVIKRTGMTQEDAEFYVEMAEEKVRAYLNLDPDADLTPYVYQISDIATLYWQKDQSISQTKWSLGYGRETFQEGSVKHTIATMTGSVIFSTYDEAVINVLQTLDGTDGMVEFL